MRKFTLLIVLFVLVINVRTKSQTIDLIPNLNPSHAGFFSDYKPIIFNGSMYFFYSAFDYKTHLAKYDGTVITLIPNLDTNDYGCYGEIIEYNNELYFGYIKSNNSNIFYLAKYNGNTISIINNLNNVDEGYHGSPVVYNNELYFFYKNDNIQTNLAKLIGSNIILIPNLNVQDMGVYGNPIVFNNKIYLGYRKFPYGKYLTEFNGNSYNIIANPFPDNEYNGFYGNIFIFQNNICLDIEYGIGGFGFAKYDGNTITLIPMPSNGEYIVNNNDLYFISPQVFLNNNNCLAKYDGNTTVLYPTIDSTDHGITPNLIAYNNEIYFPYLKDKGFLGKLNGNSISLISSPPNISVDGNSFVYGNNLYFSCLTSSTTTRLQIGKFDGNSISLLQNPDTLDLGYLGMPIQYNNSLYFKYCVSVSPEKYQLARFNDSTVTVGKPLFKDNSISLYPNPATNILVINNLKNTSDICIFDINGKLILNKEVKENAQIDISHLAKGVYIVKIKDEADIMVRKFMKD